MMRREMRAAFSLGEVLVSTAVLGTVLVVACEGLAAGHRSLSRTEDAVAFQRVAAKVMDAAAAESFEFIRLQAPVQDERPGVAWTRWQERALGPIPGDLQVLSRQDPTDDPDLVLLRVTVSWRRPELRGRRTHSSFQLARLFSDPAASLRGTDER